MPMNTTNQRTKCHKRIKLRRLANNPLNDPDLLIKGQPPIGHHYLQKLSCILFTTTCLAFAAAILVGHHHYLAQRKANQSSLLDDFLSSYRRQYYQIVHGRPHYCEEELDTKTLFARIGEDRILHQDDALQKLQTLLSKHTQFSSIAFVGPSGVGKTLTARSLSEHFIWRENVWNYAWNTHVDSEVQKFQMLRLFVEQLSDCGQNLLIIDNLTPCDDELVPILHHILATHDSASKKSVILLFIFKLNALGEIDLYQRHCEALQQLPDTTTVNFKPLNEAQMRDCIQREMELGNFSLSEAAFDEITATINVTTSGCKKVHSKLLVHAQPLM